MKVGSNGVMKNMGPGSGSIREVADLRENPASVRYFAREVHIATNITNLADQRARIRVGVITQYEEKLL